MTALDWLKNYFPVIVLMFGAIWASVDWVVMPRAEQFINDTIGARKYATAGTVEGVKATASSTDKRVKAIRDTQIRTETKLQSMEVLLKEQRDLSNQILLRLPKSN